MNELTNLWLAESRRAESLAAARARGAQAARRAALRAQHAHEPAEVRLSGTAPRTVPAWWRALEAGRTAPSPSCPQLVRHGTATPDGDRAAC